MTKTQTFQNKNMDLKTLYENIKEILVNEKFRIIKDEITESVYHLKAEKTGIKRIIIGALRNLELVIAGDPNTFAITLSVGAWGKNLAFSSTIGYVVASVGGGLPLAYGTIAASGSYLMARTFEGDFWTKILREIDRLSNTPQ
jgi:hypothetical protein